MARIGYFQGTDPLLLSVFAAEGVETLPVANIMDKHGKNVNQLSKGEVDVLVGYLHKIIPAEQVRTASLSLMVESMLSACAAHKIPVLLVAPADSHDKAKKLLGDTKADVHIVAPKEVEAQIRKYI
jgi:hypothetical protein